MSQSQGNVTLPKECHTSKGMSHFQWNTTYSRECHTFKEISNFKGYVTLLSQKCERTILGLKDLKIGNESKKPLIE